MLSQFVNISKFSESSGFECRDKGRKSSREVFILLMLMSSLFAAVVPTTAFEICLTGGKLKALHAEQKFKDFLIIWRLEVFLFVIFTSLGVSSILGLVDRARLNHTIIW